MELCLYVFKGEYVGWFVCLLGTIYDEYIYKFVNKSLF